MAAQSALAFALDDLPTPRPPMALVRPRPRARTDHAVASRSGAPVQTPEQEKDLFGAGHAPDPAFELGWDFAHHGLMPPAEHLFPGHALRRGWEAGQASFGGRTLRCGRGVRRWLHLRLEAWRAGQSFESVQVTPNFLAQIEATRCPITRADLCDDAHREADTAIERLNRQAGFAAGNLVAMSRTAQQAKADKRWDDARTMAALAQTRQAENGHGIVEGLNSAQWARLSTLMSFATPLPHELAAGLPLRVLPPNRVRLINPIQGLQALITLQLAHAGFAARIARFTRMLPSVDLRRDFHLFFHSLLPRTWQGGRPENDQVMRDRLEDAWGDADVLRRWQRFSSQISARLAESLVQRLLAQGLATGIPGAQRPRGATWHSPASATEGWALERQGRAPQTC